MGIKNKTIEVRVIFKAIDIINGNACHFITFEELSTRERVYLQVGIGNYMMIIEGDRGELCYKEHKKRYKSKFIFFERVVYGVKKDSILIDQIHEGEATILGKEFVDILETSKAPNMDENNREDVADFEMEEAPVVEETHYDTEVCQDEKEVVAVSKKK